MSALMERFGINRLLGKMFGGTRDLYKVFGYSSNTPYEGAVGRYRRQDIASRIVEAPADALWANPPQIEASETFQKAWQSIVLDANLWNALNRVDCMAGMGEYAALMIGFDDGSKLDQPIVTKAGRKVTYLQPYSQPAAEIKSLVSDPRDPRYMKPALYTIKPGSDPLTKSHPKGSTAATTAARTFDAHYSRILHVGENYLQDEVFGNPRLIRVWNLLDDVLKVAGGTAETFWLAGNRGMQVDVDKEMELTPDDEKDLNAEIEEYVNQLRRVIRTRGVKVTNLGSDVPNPAHIFEMLLSLISGATGIPKRILLGSEMGQLASGQDRNNWAERIEERRMKFGEPVVLRPLIKTFIRAGVLPDEPYVIHWPSAFKLTPLERAQTSAQTARSAANLAKAMDTNPNLVSLEEARNIIEVGDNKATNKNK